MSIENNFGISKEEGARRINLETHARLLAQWAGLDAQSLSLPSDPRDEQRLEYIRQPRAAETTPEGPDDTYQDAA